MLIFRAWTTCDSIALTAKKVVAIDFYRLTDIIDINKNVIIESYWLIDLFSDIVIYWLHWQGLLFIDCTDRAVFQQMNYS